MATHENVSVDIFGGFVFAKTSHNRFVTSVLSGSEASDFKGYLFVMNVGGPALKCDHALLHDMKGFLNYFELTKLVSARIWTELIDQWHMGRIH